jgi:hypothetical protein
MRPSLMRIETPKGLSVSAEMDESVWTIRIARNGKPAAALPEARTQAATTAAARASRRC